MSKDMQFLFQKMSRYLPPTDEPPKTSESLRLLYGRMSTRRWKQNMLEALRVLLWELDSELMVIEHVLGCHDCQLEWQLGVERYHGTRCPWYLNLGNDVGPFYPDCPKVEDYEFGSYWTRDEGKALPFVVARLKWAKKIIGKEFAASSTVINALENWDIEQGPDCRCLTEMLDEVAGIEINYAPNSIEQIYAEDSS